MSETAAAIDLTLLRGPLRRWFLRIVALGLAAALVGYFASALLPREYEGEARILVGSLTETSTDQLAAYQQLAQTYSTIATSTSLLGRAISRLGLSDNPIDLRKRIDVRALQGQAIIVIDARATSPEAAALLANEIAAEVVKLGASSTPDASSLATIFEPASAVLEPSSPRVVLNTGVAAALGVLLGIGLMVRSSLPPAGEAQSPAPIATKPGLRPRRSIGLTQPGQPE